MQQAKYPHVQSNSDNTWQSHFKTVFLLLDLLRRHADHIRKTLRNRPPTRTRGHQKGASELFKALWGNTCRVEIGAVHGSHSDIWSSKFYRFCTYSILWKAAQDTVAKIARVFYIFARLVNTHQDAPRLISFSCYSPILHTFEVVNLKASKIGIRLN